MLIFFTGKSFPFLNLVQIIFKKCIVCCIGFYEISPRFIQLVMLSSVRYSLFFAARSSTLVRTVFGSRALRPRGCGPLRRQWEGPDAIHHPVLPAEKYEVLQGSTLLQRQSPDADRWSFYFLFSYFQEKKHWLFLFSTYTHIQRLILNNFCSYVWGREIV